MAIIICQRSELWWFWKGFWKECMVMEFDIHENMWSKNILCKKFGCSPKGAVEVSCWRKVLLLAGTSALILFYSRVATNSEHPSPWKCKVLWYIHVYDIELRHFSWVAGLATQLKCLNSMSYTWVYHKTIQYQWLGGSYRNL